MTRTYIGIGANLGTPGETASMAMADLGQLPSSAVTGRSALYRSAPLGVAPQADFINAVVRVDTELEPETLLNELQAIEQRHGRTRPYPGAPRTLDLDLLLFGDFTYSTPRLTVPHPRMHQRAFVLRPLLDLDPAILIPGKGPATTLLAACRSQPIELLD